MCKCSPLRTYVPLDDRRVVGQFSWRNRDDQQTPGWALPTDSPTKWTSAPFLPAAAAKLLQSCLTLCDPIDGSPPGSSVPGILQARILEWVAISFSNACMHAKLLQSWPTVWRYGQQPTRLFCPRDSLGKNTGVGFHFLLPWGTTVWRLLMVLLLTHTNWSQGPRNSHLGVCVKAAFCVCVKLTLWDVPTN